MEKFMTSVIKIGNLSLDMGNMSHAIGVIKNNLETYLKYLTYQASFNGVK